MKPDRYDLLVPKVASIYRIHRRYTNIDLITTIFSQAQEISPFEWRSRWSSVLGQIYWNGDIETVNFWLYSDLIHRTTKLFSNNKITIYSIQLKSPEKSHTWARSCLGKPVKNVTRLSGEYDTVFLGLSIHFEYWRILCYIRFVKWYAKWLFNCSLV